MITGSVVLISLASLLLGLAAGFVMHRSDYCVAGMFRDLFLFKDAGRLRVLLLQIALAMILFEFARLAGLLPFHPFPVLRSPSLSDVLGGLLFGLGMVLAGGCVFGTLYKMGAGSVVSASAFLGLILGSGLYPVLSPWWEPLVKATRFSAEAITAPQALGTGPTGIVLLFAAIFLVFFLKWRREKLWHRPVSVRGYVQPWITAVILAALGLAAVLLMGLPLGVSAIFAKLAALLASSVVPDYVAQHPFFYRLSLDVIHPLSGAQLRGGPGPQLDAFAFMQFPLLAGIILGSGLSALLLREFALRFRVPPGQLLAALGGGIFMGLAARMASGCNIWHLLGGLPVFALQSSLFVAGLLPGAWLGGKMIRALVQKTGYYYRGKNERRKPS